MPDFLRSSRMRLVGVHDENIRQMVLLPTDISRIGLRRKTSNRIDCQSCYGRTYFRRERKNTQMRLAAWRQSKRRTQASVALALGVAVSTVASWEQGKKIPGAAFMVLIYRMTEGAVSPNDFYDLPDLHHPAACEQRHERSSQSILRRIAKACGANLRRPAGAQRYQPDYSGLNCAAGHDRRTRGARLSRSREGVLSGKR